MSWVAMFYRRIKLLFQNIRYSQLEQFKKNGGHIGVSCEIHGRVNFGSEPYLIYIGNRVRISDGVVFSTHDGGMWVLRNLGLLSGADRISEIHVGNNVQIGYRVIINQGVKIGDNCVIASGAIVTHDVKSGTVVGGIPARELETIEAYYEKSKDLCVYTKHMNSDEKRKYLLYLNNNE